MSKSKHDDKPYEVGKGKPPKDTRFKPGNKANPLGGGAHNPEIKKIKTLTNKEVAEVGSLLLKNDFEEVRKISNEKKGTPILRSWIAKVATKAHAKGDMLTLDKLLDRVSGKVQQKVELTGGEGGPIKTETVRLSKEERDAEIAKLDRMRDEIGDE